MAATLANSPAEKGGLRGGDVILSFDGHVVRDDKDLRNRVAEAQVGTQTPISLLREGKPLQLTTVMEEEPPSP